MWFWRKFVVRRLEAEIARLEAELAAERKISDKLVMSLTQVSDPENWSSTANWYVEDEPAVIEVMDETGEVVEAIAPAAYDWQRLAWDIYDSEMEDPNA